MSIISNEHQSGSPFDSERESDAPKLPSDHEQITRMMAAFTATMAALEPLSEAERLRVLNAVRILTDRGTP